MGCDTCVFYPPSACDGKPCCVCDTDDALFNCYQPTCEKEGADMVEYIERGAPMRERKEAMQEGGKAKW